jgi:hypothetical protein
MEQKLTAVYVMARKEELTEADHGSYDRLLNQQKAACLQLLQEKFSDEGRGPVEVYASRSQLLMDVERHRIKRLVVERLDRLGAHPDEIEGILFELRSQAIEVLTAMP